MELDYIALGVRVKSAREAKRLTQAQLAELCGVSVSHIGHIERGSRKLSVEMLFAVSVSLNVSLDYLLFDSAGADENIFANINAILKTKPPAKVKTFLTTVKALADKIDEL